MSKKIIATGSALDINMAILSLMGKLIKQNEKAGLPEQALLM